MEVTRCEGLRERLRLVEWVDITRETVMAEETPCGPGERGPEEVAVLGEARGRWDEEAAYEAIGSMGCEGGAFLGRQSALG